MGEAVVAPGTPDAVRHHDPRKDRQRGPARRVDLGLGRGGFKGDGVGSGAAGRSASQDRKHQGGEEVLLFAVVSHNCHSRRLILWRWDAAKANGPHSAG